MSCKTCFEIDKELLPFKFHFFIFSAGFAGVIPFITLVAKELGIDASRVGIVYSIIPVSVLLSNPILGLLVDYLRDIKKFLIFLVLISAVSYISINFLPPISDSVNLKLLPLNHTKSQDELNFLYDRACLEEILDSEVICSLSWDSGSHGNQSCDLDSYLFRTNLTKTGYKPEIIQYPYEGTFNSPVCEFGPRSAFLNCTPDTSLCSVKLTNFLFHSYQFWIFIVLTFIAQTAVASCSSLSSVACYEILGSRGHLYGRQRLFGTISWGLVCPLAGFLNDSVSSLKKYSAGFYLLTAFSIFDCAILSKMSLPKVNYSTNMCKDMRKILTSSEILTFGLGLLFTGAFNSMIYLYEFWFLESLNASKTLLGLTIAMQCLVGEVPFLYFGGWFVKKLGYFPCLAVVFAGYSLRFVFYSIIQNPWLVLPVDVLHGVTFGIYHAATTAFSKAKAPPGLEATTYGVLNGIHEGLGYGVGSLVGGYGLQYFGARKLYFAACIVSVLCIVCFSIVSFKFRSVPKEKEKERDKTEDASMNVL